MPRLDNTDEWVIEEFDLEFDSEDPGATDPIDLCLICFDEIRRRCEAAELDEIDHPPYAENYIVCEMCGEELYSDDD